MPAKSPATFQSSLDQDPMEHMRKTVRLVRLETGEVGSNLRRDQVRRFRSFLCRVDRDGVQSQVGRLKPSHLNPSQAIGDGQGQIAKLDTSEAVFASHN